MTDPDWEPVMKRASAIVTNRGGRTCHAAIIARELGMPAVVGCGDATRSDQGRPGRHGVLRRRRYRLRLRRVSWSSSSSRSSSTRCRTLPVKIMMNVGNPDRAFDFAEHPEPRRRPCAARVHHQPHDRRASAGAARVRSVSTPTCRSTIRAQMAGYADPVEFFVDKLAEGIAQIAAAFAPRAGHRASVGLQVERVCEPHRRPRSTSRARKTRCSGSAAPRAMSIEPSGPASSSSAAR